VQEFALQGLLARNLRLAGLPEAAVVAAAGLAFGAAHLPDLPLAGMTAAVGVLWTWAFRRRSNLWILALSHAWLGTLAFYWVLGRDPWLEMR
jgi:membrane protease YdiL (CAAX protease family)